MVANDSFILTTGNCLMNWAFPIFLMMEKWLEPINQRIHKELLNCEVLHTDESRIQCNKEPGKAASSDSYIWVMCSGRSEARQAVYFQYARNHSRETAKSLLSGFQGHLMTDAYEAYNKIEGVIRSLCWAHVRRKFVDSIPGGFAEANRRTARCGSAHSGSAVWGKEAETLGREPSHLGFLLVLGRKDRDSA